jgi:cell division protein ZapE
MDCFHNTIPFPETLRAHFHSFMAQIHTDLNRRLGEQDPLRPIALQLAQRARVICFDEFFVSDIADAMLLGTLFRHLFTQGVTLVATSNVPPQDLYRGGLQREQFLPAIALLEHHTAVVEIGSGEDFRLRALTAAETYHTPLDAAGEVMLAKQFMRLCPHPNAGHVNVTVLGRNIPARGVGGNVAWFDFFTLCGVGRSQQDYLELAARFETLLISQIPILDALHDDAARRLIHLVDIAYDHGIKLILTAEGAPEALYQGERLAFEFTRTASRLREMSGTEYLALAHRF